MRLAQLSFALIVHLLLAMPAFSQPPPRGPAAGGATATDNARRVPARPTSATAPAGAPPRVYTRQLAFTIPFQVSSGADGQQPTEVHLFVSSDGGQTYTPYAKQVPTAEKFAFRASADGSYLFLVRTIDARGRMYPTDVARPELEVVVDTLAPKLLLETSLGPAGELRAKWTMADPQLALETFSLQYQAGPDGTWQTVAAPSPTAGQVDGELVGNTMWGLHESVGEVRVRAQVRDRAGNVSVVHRTIDKAGVTTDSADVAARQEPANEAPDPITAPQETRYPRTPFAPVQPRTVATPITDTTGTPASLAGTAADTSAADQAGVPWPASNGGDQPGPNHGRTADTYGVNQDRGANPLATDPPSAGRATPVAERSGESPTGKHRFASLDTSDLPPGEKPNMTSARSFRLEYDVDSVGPSGVRRVELWQTRDAGRTWQPVGVDDDNRSPIVVKPPEEGIFGYRIVVESGNGLTGPPPRPGDLAEIWIGVDWTKPRAEITSAPYGSGSRAGELEIHWLAEDARLAQRPVSLLFSDKPTGPWSPIASGLPNNGVYHWRVDSRVPRDIYLRLEVRDAAGNLAVHQLDRSIANDGLVPQGRIRSILPVDSDARRRSGLGPARR